MSTQNNIVFLIGNYKENLKKKMKKSSAKVPSLKQKGSTRLNSASFIEPDDSLLDNLSTGDLNFLNKMTYLRSFADKKPLNVILDPSNRFQQMKKNKADFKLNLRKKLKETNISEKESIKDLNLDDNFGKKNDNPIQNSFWNSTIMENQKKNTTKKKVSIMVSSFGIDLNKNYRENNDSDSDTDTDPDSEDSENRSDDSKKRIIREMFEELPHTLIQFPDEVDPLDFFSQYNNQIGKYIEYIDHCYKINDRLKMSFCNDFFGLYSGFLLEAKDQMGNSFEIAFPFSASYLISNFPPVVQLCFFNNYITNQLKRHKKVLNSFDYDIFSNTLKSLCGIEVQRVSVMTLKSKTRKSIFGNSKLNTVFGDKNDSSEHLGNSNILPHFESKKEQHTFTHNMTAMNPKKNIVKSNIMAKSENKEAVQQNKGIIDNINVSQFLSGGEDNKTNFKEDNEEDSGFNNRSSEYSQSQSNSSQSQRKETEESSKIKSSESEGKLSGSNTESNLTESSKDESSDLNSESESDSDSDSDSDSMGEEEYSSKNPFEIKYAKVNFKFKIFELGIVKPAMYDFNDKFVRELEGKEVYGILTNNPPGGD